jgi:hypothetical protein
MRYYFHLRDAAHAIRDEEGVELSRFGDASKEILRTLKELHTENPGLAQEASGWTLDVADAVGTVFFRFRSIAPVTEGPASRCYRSFSSRSFSIILRTCSRMAAA